MNGSKKQYIIIGASAAGLSATVTLRSLDAHCSIICISDEAFWPYNKCLLPDYVSGDRALESIFTRPQRFFEESNIQLMLNTRVAEINPHEQRILLSNGSWLAYDSLVIATGARPRKLSDSSDAIEGIFNGYYLNNVESMLHYLHKNNVKQACVVGTGFTGLEYADALNTLGVRVTLIEKESYVLPHLINESMSHILQERIERHTISIVCNRVVESINQRDNELSGVILNDGTHIEAQVIIHAIGSIPNVELMKNAGGEVTKNGIVTNECMQTSIANIYAAGDCAQVKDLITGASVRSFKWSDAALQGSCAAYAIAGSPKKYDGVACVLKSAFFGFDIFIAGKNPRTAHEHLIGSFQNDFGVFDLRDDLIDYALIIGHRDLVPEIRKTYRQRLSFTSYRNRNVQHS